MGESIQPNPDESDAADMVPGSVGPLDAHSDSQAGSADPAPDGGGPVDTEPSADSEGERPTPQGVETAPAPDDEATDAEPEATYGDPDATDGEPEATDGDPDVTDGEPEATDGDLEATDGEPEATDGDPDVTDGEPEATDGDLEATDGEPHATDGKPDATDGEPDSPPDADAPPHAEAAAGADSSGEHGAAPEGEEGSAASAATSEVPGEASDAALKERAEEEGVSMMELLMEEGDYMPEAFERGDVITGHVLRKEEDQLILDVGAKREGVVPSSDIARLPAHTLDDVAVGDEIEVVVLRRPVGDGELLVSINQALTRQDWRNATQVMESGEIVELTVAGYNKGGALVDFGALQGFVPKSHLVSLSRFPEDVPMNERLRQLTGDTIPVKVIEVNRRQRRLIMSERRAVREWRAAQKRELLADLHEGEVRKGTVSSIADFGVFVDLGGADGLVHVSELTYERSRSPKDLVKVGQEVEVYVLSLDRERKRIGLSMKRLQRDPWSAAEEDHYVGQIVDADITNLTKFGAFARLPSGLEGLIHVSELADHHVANASEVVQPGQRVAVEIISIDTERQRIGLSIRRVPEHLRRVEEPETESAGAEDDEADVAADGDADEETTDGQLDEAAADEDTASEVLADERVESDAAADEGAEHDDADAGSKKADTGHEDENAGHEEAGAGHEDEDAGHEEAGAGHEDEDAGSEEADAGSAGEEEPAPDTQEGEPAS